MSRQMQSTSMLQTAHVHESSGNAASLCDIHESRGNAASLRYVSAVLIREYGPRRPA
jgi:hypothetical protein